MLIDEYSIRYFLSFHSIFVVSFSLLRDEGPSTFLFFLWSETFCKRKLNYTIDFIWDSRFQPHFRLILIFHIFDKGPLASFNVLNSSFLFADLTYNDRNTARYPDAVELHEFFHLSCLINKEKEKVKEANSISSIFTEFEMEFLWGIELMIEKMAKYTLSI